MTPHPPSTRVRVPTPSGPQWGTVENRRHGSLIDEPAATDGKARFEWRGEPFTRTPQGDYFVKLDAGGFVRVNEREIQQ